MKRFILAALFALSLAAPAVAGDLQTGVPYIAVQGGVATANTAADGRDDQFFGAVAGGLDFGPIRAELEYVNLDSNKSGLVDVNIVGVNVFAEPFTYRKFTPYVGGGIGYGFFRGQGVTANHTDSLVYNVQVGTSYEINTNWALTAGYRYVVSAEDNTYQNDGRAANFETHVYQAGARYTF